MFTPGVNIFAVCPQSTGYILTCDFGTDIKKPAPGIKKHAEFLNLSRFVEIGSLTNFLRATSDVWTQLYEDLV